MDLPQSAMRRLRALRDPSFVQASFAFVLSRTLIFVIFIVASHFISATELPEPTTSPYVVLTLPNTVRALSTLASTNDAYWYAQIAREGYEQRPFENTSQHNWAFFPLFPLLWSGLTFITGELPLTGMLLANICFFAALVVLHKLVGVLGYEATTADRTVLYIAIFPTSYFFSLPWTESLFLLLTVSTVYAAQRRAWWIAGLLGALATATRSTGLFLLPVLALVYWQTYGLRLNRYAFALALPLLGIGLFMLHLHNLTGNALAFIDAQAAWNRQSSMFWTPLLEFLGHPSLIMAPWNFKVVNFAAALLGLVCCAYLLRKRDWSLAAYTALSLLAPLSTNNLQSMARFTMVMFPVLIMVGYAGRSSRIHTAIIIGFVALLAIMVTLFVAGYTLAGA